VQDEIAVFEASALTGTEKSNLSLAGSLGRTPPDRQSNILSWSIGIQMCNLQTRPVLILPSNLFSIGCLFSEAIFRDLENYSGNIQKWS